MTYQEWLKLVPEAIEADALWRFDAYRKALFLYDLAWDDCDLLRRDPRGRSLVGQLITAAGSVPANMEEGFGRGFGKDRDYFLRVSTGSGREVRGWYFRNRRLLPPAILEHRINHWSAVIALLVTELNKNRRR